MSEATNLFDAPIPGQSLTTEGGSRPWEQEPMYNTVEEAFEFYATRITDPLINESLLDAVEMGTPITSIAEILVQNSAMEGKHNIDVSILVLPVVMELIAYVAEEAGVKYNMGTEEEINQDIIPAGKIALAVSKIQNKEPKEKMPMVEPEAVPEDGPQTSGLMSRRM